MLGRIVDAILGLHGVAAYAVVGVLAFGEAAAFVGLVLPGEIAVLLGGVVTAAGQASLPWMLVVAIVAAIAGDSVGYEVGRHVGPQILSWEPIRRRTEDKVKTASAYLKEKGGRAVFLGRWTSLLRALIPGLAGMAGMRYRRFLVFNVLGGVAWATTYVLLGYAAGASWRRVEAVAGRASLILLVLIVLALLVRWATRRLVARADDVREWFAALGRTAPVQWVRSRYGRQLAWLRTRLTPGTARGLGWTASALLMVGAGWVVGAIVQDVLAGEELALLDRPLARWIASHTTAEAVRVADLVTDALSPMVGLWLPAAGLVYVGRVADRAAVVRAAVGVTLATVGAYALEMVLPTTGAGTRFPAVAVAFVAATVASILPAATANDWHVAIRIAGIGTMLIVLAALAALVAGDAALSGVLGGLALGVFVVVAVEFTARTLATEPGT